MSAGANTRRALATLAAALAACLPTSAARAQVGACRLGRVVAEQALLKPQPRTFYSVDALNPDVVRKGRTYYMFFSGNNVHTFGGDWRTGVATSRSPLGPFRVRPGFVGPFVNGGTAVWRGGFWQATYRYGQGPVLMSSSDAMKWRVVAPIRAPAGWPLVADFYLQPLRGRLRMFMLVRRSETIAAGGTIAVMDWVLSGRRWSGFRTLLGPGSEPWENLDLGEPAFAHAPGRDLLLYTATAAGDATRTIGLARRSGSRWKRCSRAPLIDTGAPWGPAVSIDPSVLVEGRRIYVYYGAGSGRSIAADLGGAIGVRVYQLPRRTSRGQSAEPSSAQTLLMLRRRFEGNS